MNLTHLTYRGRRLRLPSGAYQARSATYPAQAGIAYAADFIAAVQAAGGTLTAGQQQALRRLETDLLAAGLLHPTDRSQCLLRAWWPMVGGTAVAHALSFVNPAQYPLTFYGSPLHSAMGLKPNGINQYADTGFLLDNDPGFDLGAALHFYSGEDLAQQEPYDLGAYSNIGALHLSTRVGALGGAAFARGFTRQTDLIGPATLPDGRGLFTVNVVVHTPLSVTGTLLRNAQALTTQTYPPESAPGTSPLYLSALNLNGMPYGYSATECRGAGVSYPLTTGQLSGLYQAVQQFNSTLNRAV